MPLSFLQLPISELAEVSLWNNQRSSRVNMRLQVGKTVAWRMHDEFGDVVSLDLDLDGIDRLGVEHGFPHVSV